MRLEYKCLRWWSIILWGSLSWGSANHGFLYKDIHKAGYPELLFDKVLYMTYVIMYPIICGILDKFNCSGNLVQVRFCTSLSMDCLTLAWYHKANALVVSCALKFCWICEYICIRVTLSRQCVYWPKPLARLPACERSRGTVSHCYIHVIIHTLYMYTCLSSSSPSAMPHGVSHHDPPLVPIQNTCQLYSLLSVRLSSRFFLCLPLLLFPSILPVGTRMRCSIVFHLTTWPKNMNGLSLSDILYEWPFCLCPVQYLFISCPIHKRKFEHST